MSKEQLNLVFVVADTFRADHLGCYGNTRVKTPCLDAFARQGVRFTNCYADGLPTIPERRVFFTGRSIIPDKVHGGWTPLRKDDVTLPAVLKRNDYMNAFITDTYHYFKADMNFHADFHSWEWIRGQETDRWKSGPREDFDPGKHMPDHLWNTKGAGGLNYHKSMLQYMMNTQDIRTEDDYFCARTFRSAMTWLEQNRTCQPFLLFVDTFDPHEPWDAPPRFQKMYYDNYPCERFLFGYGVHKKDIRPEDHDAIRALYAAEVSFVDMWFGRFLARLDELGYGENTIVVFTTDHGTHLGEEGCFQKTPWLLNSCVAQLPLIVRHPDSAFAGNTVDALVSSVDYMPTFLKMLSAREQPEMDGVSFWDLATGDVESIHDRVFSQFRGFAAVRDKYWHYSQHQEGEHPGNGPYLYDLNEDPEEKKNVLRDHPDVAGKMRSILAARLDMDLPEV